MIGCSSVKNNFRSAGFQPSTIKLTTSNKNEFIQRISIIQYKSG